MTLRSPLLHFLLLGGLLFAGQRLFFPGDAAPVEPIVVSAARLERMRADAVREDGRAPTPRELRGLVESWMREELLYREALRRGLDRDDLVIRRRLTDEMRLLAGDPGLDAAELYRKAQELGLGKSDVIVRRRLIRKMTLMAVAEGGPIRPTEDEMRGYLERQPERFLEPPRLRLSHVFFARDLRTHPEADARELLAVLRREATPPEEAVALGDSFLLGHHLPPRTPSQLERSLGPSFAAAVTALPPGRWSEPVESSYGVHLVWVHEAAPARWKALEDVRAQVLQGLAGEERERRVARFVESLRLRYPVEIDPAYVEELQEPMPPDSKLSEKTENGVTSPAMTPSGW